MRFHIPESTAKIIFLLEIVTSTQNKRQKQPTRALSIIDDIATTLADSSIISDAVGSATSSSSSKSIATKQGGLAIKMKLPNIHTGL